MNTNTINLFDLIALWEDEQLSKEYISYKLNWDENKKYRHHEIIDIKSMVDSVLLDRTFLDGFIYSYSISQLNKEFDLLKITDMSVINIEVKGEQICEERIKKQLMQNRHYLKMISKDIISITYVSSIRKFYMLLDDELTECSTYQIKEILCENKINNDIDLDELFSPSKVLVSPINNCDEFISDNYLLTQQQLEYKKKIIELINNNIDKYIGITGKAGTGKTLLLYDIIKEIKKTKKPTIIHCGDINDGHRTLFNKYGYEIFPAKYITNHDFEECEIFFIDEAQRIYAPQLSKIISICQERNLKCIFSFDGIQILSKSESTANSTNRISEICENNVFELKGKIRTNVEIASFIISLFDLKKIIKGRKYPNVDILYCPNKKMAGDIARKMSTGYTFISITNSNFNSRLDYQYSRVNTHKVIGQEFNNVVMVLDEAFGYDDYGILCCAPHPNPNYLFDKLLYQGLTRARSKIKLIITDKELFSNILKIVK